MIQLKRMRSRLILLSRIVAFVLDMMAYECVFHRSELLFRVCFNFSSADRYLVVEEVADLGALVLVEGPFC